MNQQYRNLTPLAFLGCTADYKQEPRIVPKNISVRQYSLCLKKLINEVW